jgi:hypothetical protein
LLSSATRRLARRRCSCCPGSRNIRRRSSRLRLAIPPATPAPATASRSFTASTLAAAAFAWASAAAKRADSVGACRGLAEATMVNDPEWRDLRQGIKWHASTSMRRHDDMDQNQQRSLAARDRRLAKRLGFKKARVGVPRKLGTFTPCGRTDTVPLARSRRLIA